MEEKKEINKNWEKYYKALEEIRKSGICNMWEGDRYLRLKFPKLTEDESVKILLNWMHNYSELNKMYNWQR